MGPADGQDPKPEAASTEQPHPPWQVCRGQGELGERRQGDSGGQEPARHLPPGSGARRSVRCRSTLGTCGLPSWCLIQPGPQDSHRTTHSHSDPDVCKHAKNVGLGANEVGCSGTDATTPLLTFQDERLEVPYPRLQEAGLRRIDAAVCSFFLAVTLLSVASLALQNRIVLPTWSRPGPGAHHHLHDLAVVLLVAGVCNQRESNESAWLKMLCNSLMLQESIS